MKIEIVKGIVTGSGGKNYGKGETLELEKAYAERLIRLGYAKAAEGEKKKPDEEPPAEGEKKKPIEESTEEGEKKKPNEESTEGGKKKKPTKESTAGGA